MAPYRTPPPPDANAPKATPVLEELVIYGACVVFGASHLVYAIVFRREVSGLMALTLFLGCWGARALALRLRRDARGP